MKKKLSYIEGNFIVIKSTGIPHHKSPYFATTSSQYVADSRPVPSFYIRTYLLIDKDKRIRGVYNGTLELEGIQLIKDISILKAEQP
jgi:protein SCO1/2